MISFPSAAWVSDLRRNECMIYLANTIEIRAIKLFSKRDLTGTEIISGSLMD